MRVANIENNSLNWVSSSSAGALDMTNCDFSERRARDEMRHIIGSSEPDVIIGSDKDHIEFLCKLYESQAAYYVHELTSEASSRMMCIVKIVAMPGTRAAAALCMSGLAACDDGGPGFVNASVRTITNARQVAVRLQSKCNGTHRHARVDAEDTIGRRGANGNVGAPSRQSNRGTTEKRTSRSWRCGSRERERRMQTGYAASSMKMLRIKG